MYQKLKAKFYKEDGNWYLESDVYSKEECQMIQGADILLSMLTDEDNITLMVCNEHFPASMDVLDIVNTTEEGTYYVSFKYNISVFLCPLLEKVFKEIPKSIYYETIR